MLAFFKKRLFSNHHCFPSISSISCYIKKAHEPVGNVSNSILARVPRQL